MNLKINTQYDISHNKGCKVGSGKFCLYAKIEDNKEVIKMDTLGHTKTLKHGTTIEQAINHVIELFNSNKMTLGKITGTLSA